MPYLYINDFENGLDTRRSVFSAPAGSLRELYNCHITPGKEIERRKKWVRQGHLLRTDYPASPYFVGPAFVSEGPGFIGVLSPKGISDQATPAITWDSDAQYAVKIFYPAEPGVTIAKCYAMEHFVGFTYAVVKYTDGRVKHLCSKTDEYEGANAQLDGVAVGLYDVPLMNTNIAGATATVDALARALIDELSAFPHLEDIRVTSRQEANIAPGGPVSTPSGPLVYFRTKPDTRVSSVSITYTGGGSPGTTFFEAGGPPNVTGSSRTVNRLVPQATTEVTQACGVSVFDIEGVSEVPISASSITFPAGLTQQEACQYLADQITAYTNIVDVTVAPHPTMAGMFVVEVRSERFDTMTTPEYVERLNAWLPSTVGNNTTGFGSTTYIEVGPRTVGVAAYPGGAGWGYIELGRAAFDPAQTYTAGITVDVGVSPISILRSVVSTVQAGSCGIPLYVRPALGRMFAMSSTGVLYGTGFSYNAGAGENPADALPDPRAWIDVTPGGAVGVVDSVQLDIAALDPNVGPLTTVVEYQGNLAVFGRSGTQIWNMTDDPNQIVNLQVLRGVGCIAPLSAQVINGTDVYFLDRSGVRSLQARDSSNSAATIDVGSPVDRDIQRLLKGMTTREQYQISATVDPESGRYLIRIKDNIYVLSRFAAAQVTSWSTYSVSRYGEYVSTGGIGDTFPEAVRLLNYAGKVACADAEVVYLLGGFDGGEYGGATSRIVTSFMDMGRPMTAKQLKSMDVGAEGGWTLYFRTRPDEALSKVGFVSAPTYFDGRVGAEANFTHIQLVLETDEDAGAAAVSSVALMFDAEQEDSDGKN